MDFWLLKVKNKSDLLPHPAVLIKEGYYLLPLDGSDDYIKRYKPLIAFEQIINDFNSFPFDEIIDLSEIRCPKCGKVMFLIGNKDICPYCDEHGYLYRAIFSLRAEILYLQQTIRIAARDQQIRYLEERLNSLESRFSEFNTEFMKDIIKPIAFLKEKIEKLENALKKRK